ncbi:MAG: tetratricopeptide repeat-containing sensor histidine kinase [Flavobacteriales bacterium]|nr:tetratricopeptide repeat-containing sensor histidine kinase [Flavobacteriales bacterium]
MPYQSMQGNEQNDSLRTALNLANDQGKVDILNALSFNYHRYQPDSCLYYATEALILAEKIESKAGEAKARLNIGLYYTITDQYILAEEALEKGIEIARDIADYRNLSNALGYMGVLNQMRANYNLALYYFLEALDIEKEFGSKARLVPIYGNLGNLYDQLNEFDMAKNYYSKAMEILQKENDNAHLAALYGNIGLTYQHEEKYDSALLFYNKAIAVDSFLNNLSALADNYGNLAATYLSMNQYLESRMAYEKALQIDESINNNSGIAFDLAGLSSLCLQVINDTANPEKREKILEMFNGREALLNKSLGMALRSEMISEEIGDRNYRIYGILKDIHVALGNYKQALEYNERYWKRKNEVASAEKARAFARLEAQAESEINKKKIELLEAEGSVNRIFLASAMLILVLSLVALGLIIFQLIQKRKANKQLEQLNNELQLANDAKKKFFSIIAHDLINPIGGLSTSIKIFKEDYHDLSEPERQTYLKAFSESSTKAYQLLTNLLEWGRFQKNQIPFQPKVQDVTPILKDIIGLYAQLASKKGVALEFISNGKLEARFDSYMVNSMVANLISNAIKFTENGGKVTLSASIKKPFLEIQVADTGIGMNKEKLDGLFRLGNHQHTEGTNEEKGTGLGLIMCKEFLDLHGGKCQITSKEKVGSTFTFLLPLEYIN